jgi:hypothetical protein
VVETVVGSGWWLVVGGGDGSEVGRGDGFGASVHVGGGLIRW